ncbi:hypothetical protein [Formosa algae]|nr:hypothetical protein [Formosa algae]
MRKILAVSLISISTLVSCKDEKKTVSSAVKQETTEQIVPAKNTRI